MLVSVTSRCEICDTTWLTLVTLVTTELVSQVVVTFETLPGEITTTCDTNSLLPVSVTSVTSVTTSAKDIILF